MGATKSLHYRIRMGFYTFFSKMGFPVELCSWWWSSNDMSGPGLFEYMVKQIRFDNDVPRGSPFMLCELASDSQISTKEPGRSICQTISAVLLSQYWEIYNFWAYSRYLLNLIRPAICSGGHLRYKEISWAQRKNTNHKFHRVIFIIYIYKQLAEMRIGGLQTRFWARKSDLFCFFHPIYSCIGWVFIFAIPPDDYILKKKTLEFYKQPMA